MRDEWFEWDDAKAARNLAKHAVSFEAVREVFEDSHLIERLDDRDDYGEQRFITTGMADGRLVSVVHTMRDVRIRIISARLAEPRERRLYHG